MSVFLDNRPFAADGSGEGSTVGHVLGAARAQAAKTGSLIVGIQCNRDSIPADRLESVLSRPARDFERIDLVSGRAKPVVLDALRQIRSLFAESFVAMKSSSEALAAGRVGEAMRTFGDCVSVWACTHESVVQGASLLDIKFDDLRINGKLMTDWLGDLAARLNDIRSAIETRDHVLFGDILRYEMDETLREWEAMLDGFIAHLEQVEEAPEASQF
ncbi:MAG TPA: hypothetical protein VMV94_04180 [Phycisphaerae bacterium]|nr:hypothetical protein [Phycisphaerae bacterium]